MINASFYDVSQIVENNKKSILSFISDNNIKFGDILYIGPQYQKADKEHGFIIVLDDLDFGEGEWGPSLVFDNNLQQKLSNNNIKFGDLFSKIKTWKNYNNFWLSDNNDIDFIIDEYKNNDIW